MDWTNFIHSLGHDEPTSMLDPEVYSNEDIEDDLLELDLDRQNAKNMVGQVGDKYDAKLDEAAAAPEWMVDPLLEEADDLEREQEDWQDEWRQLADKERLVKSVKSFRRRINANERDLNISELMTQTDNHEIQSELRDALKDHMRSTKQVNDLLQLFTNSRELDRERSDSTSKNLDKHRKRMQQRQNSAGDRDSSRDGEDGRQKDPIGADD